MRPLWSQTDFCNGVCKAYTTPCPLVLWIATRHFPSLNQLIFTPLKFNVHGSVHRESMSIIVQQYATMYSLLYFCELLYIFRVVTLPIIRSTYNCNYSIWLWSDFAKCSVWSQLKMRGMDPSLLTSVIVRSRKVAETVGSITLIFSWLHTLHFPKSDQSQML